MNCRGPSRAVSFCLDVQLVGRIPNMTIVGATIHCVTVPYLRNVFSTSKSCHPAKEGSYTTGYLHKIEEKNGNENLQPKWHHC